MSPPDLTTPPASVPGIALPEQLRLLEANARALASEGRHEEAEKVMRQVVAKAPRHIPGLQYLASRALVRKDFATAQDYIETAIRAAPRAAMLHQNLGVILRARGYLEGALKAFDYALGIRPELAMAWIQKGDVLQGLRRREDAIAAYRRGEELFGDLASVAAQSGPRARRAAARAIRTLRVARTRFIEEELAPIRARHAPADLERADRAIRIMIRTEVPEFADPLQRPSFAYFPGLAPKPFYPRAQFPFLDAVEKSADAIRAELERVLATAQGLKPYVDFPRLGEARWRELNRSLQWSAYHLYRDGVRIEAHCERCPHTQAAIEALPIPRLPGQSPEVFFSILRPGTHIPPHVGLANYKLTVHLPLIVPSGCAIRVGDETRSWKTGECLILDDSFEHEAWNRGDSPRAVLIFEAWHPEVTGPERELLAAAVAALDRFNRRYSRLAAGKIASRTTDTAPNSDS